MQPYAPFVGILLLSDLPPSRATSAVTSGNGEQVATLRWRRRVARNWFEILDVRGGTELAYGGPDYLDGYQIREPNGTLLLQLTPGPSGPAGWWTVTLPDGRQLTAKGNQSRTVFSIHDEGRRQVAQILTGSRAWGLPQSRNLAFELQIPMLSIVQSVGLAQCIRVAQAAVRS